MLLAANWFLKILGAKRLSSSKPVLCRYTTRGNKHVTTLQFMTAWWLRHTLIVSTMPSQAHEYSYWDRPKLISFPFHHWRKSIFLTHVQHHLDQISFFHHSTSFKNVVAVKLQTTAIIVWYTYSVRSQWQAALTAIRQIRDEQTSTIESTLCVLS